MRPPLYAVTSILLAALTIGQTPPEPAGPGTRLAWDHAGTDEGGAPEELAEFELAAAGVGGGPILASRRIPACETSGAMTCEEALAPLGLPTGTYLLRVRAIDTGGNASGWSDPLTVRLDITPPSAPTGCRLVRG